MQLHISREIQISKSTDIVYQIISDIRQWNIWSPWMQCEPTAKTNVEGVSQSPGQVLTWEGEVVGSGKMLVTQLELNKSVSMKLEFFKPWKSIAEVQFEIFSVDLKTTKVIWSMKTELPFFMFFFKKMLSAFMGRDFERGLKLLKEYAETGTVVCQSVYKGEVQLNGFQVLSKKVHCKIADLSEVLPAEFKKLEQLVQTGAVPKPQEAVGMTYHFDVPNGVCDVASGYTYSLTEKISVPHGFENTQIPNHRGLVVDYYGPYRNLTNPWAMAVGYQQARKLKVSKKIPMYEIYKVLPGGKDEKEIFTQIIVPLKN